MKKFLNLIKKNIFGIISGIVFGSIGVYAGNNMYASDVSVSAPAGSNLGSSATLQDSLDELYSMADRCTKYKEIYKNGVAIYYNPTTGEKCSESESVSLTGTKSGCMKWYTFNDEEGNSSVNLILDHNTTATVAWNSSGNNSEMKEVSTQLKNDTKAWKNAARLITANEVAKISNNVNWDSSKTGQPWFYFGSNNTTDTSKRSNYGWLYDRTRSDCKENGCLNNADQDTYGYWTSNANISGSASAWFVNRSGILSNNLVSDAYYGVRPVITISKSVIK